MISKCRKWHIRGTYLFFFLTPLEAHAFGDHGHGYAFFLVDRAGISETGILPPCELFNYKLRGGAFSAISCAVWWSVCRFLHAIKTNPHFPSIFLGGEGEGVGLGVYFDWCINILLKARLHSKSNDGTPKEVAYALDTESGCKIMK